MRSIENLDIRVMYSDKLAELYLKEGLTARVIRISQLLDKVIVTQQKNMIGDENKC